MGKFSIFMPKKKEVEEPSGFTTGFGMGNVHHPRESRMRSPGGGWGSDCDPDDLMGSGTTKKPWSKPPPRASSMLEGGDFGPGQDSPYSMRPSTKLPVASVVSSPTDEPSSKAAAQKSRSRSLEKGAAEGKGRKGSPASAEGSTDVSRAGSPARPKAKTKAGAKGKA